MNKFIKYSIGTLIILTLVLAGAFYYFTSSSVTKAFLIIDSGLIEVNSGSGWKQAVDGMLLSLNNKIRTSAESKVAIVLYESVIIQLNAGTEILISDLSKNNLQITQSIGKTWNKFTKLAGIKKIDIITPNSVATVRGTEFEIVAGAEDFQIFVIEGNVEVNSGSLKQAVGEFKRFEKSSAGFIDKGLTAEDKKLMVEKAAETLNLLKKLRFKNIHENKLFQIVQEKYKFTDEDVSAGLAMIDSGEVNEREYTEKVPVSMGMTEKFFALNDAIKEQQKLIERLKNR